MRRASTSVRVVLGLVFSLAAAVAFGASLQRTAESGGISATATPANASEITAETLDFDITLDTHSGSLDIDFLKAASLKDAAGVMHAPVAWSGGKGGHHLKGKLSFPSEGLRSSASLTLTIRSAGGARDIVFSWIQRLVST